MDARKHRVLVISDTHFGDDTSHPHTFDFLSDINKMYQPDRIVHIGDEAEFAGMSFHDHDPNSLGASCEYRKAFQHMQTLFSLFPRITFCVSNHGSRLYRRAFNAGIPIEMVRTYQSLWEAPETAIWQDRVFIDDVIYTHGDPYCGRNAAFRTMTEYHRSSVIGHTHGWGGVQYSSFPDRDGNEKTFFALNVGSLINTQSSYFDYAKKYINKPTIGCGVVIDGIHGHFIRMPENS